MVKGFKETHTGLACGSEIYEKIGTDGQMVYLTMIILPVFQKDINYVSVCLLAPLQ